MGIHANAAHLVERFAASVKIGTIDARGYYITDNNGGIRYLHDDGIIRPTVNNKRSHAFWPTRKAAENFWNKWKKDYEN